MSERKIAAFVRDAGTGAALANVLVSATVEDTKGRKEHLGQLASNASGYVSFDLAGVDSAKSVKHLWVQPVNDPEAAVDARSVAAAVRDPVVVVTTARDKVGSSRHPDLPDSLLPSASDWRFAPGSFGTNAELSVGEDDCRKIIPGNKATNRYFLREVIRDLPGEGKPETVTHRRTEFRARLRRGVVREYEVTWSPARHTLGEVVYSLPLAPCESVNLAVIDWSRSDQATRSENTTVKEHLNHSQHRDRSIEETVEASVTELQGGASYMSGANVDIPIKTVNVNAASGTGMSFSGGHRRTSARTMQDVADSLVQSSTVVRNRNSTIVLQSSQAEQDTVETRTVRNHNSCHAMTVLYHEVLRNYLVRVAFAREVEVLLVEQELVGFTEHNLHLYRHLLEPALRDTRLRPCFDAHARVMHGDDGTGQPEAPQRVAGTVERFKMRLYTGNEGSDATVYGLIGLSSGGDKKHKLTSSQNDYESGSAITYDFPVMGQGVHIEDVREVGVSYDTRDVLSDAWDFRGLRVQYLLEGESELRTLYENRSVKKFFEGDGEWRDSVDVNAGLDEAPTAEEQQAAARHAEDVACMRRLLEHLNAQQHYYNSVIWLHQNPSARAAFLDQYDYLRGTLLDYVTDRPLAVLGDYIAYPLRDPQAGEHDFTPPAPVERVVSLPARGVFAEAQLSNCNVCEKRDITRAKDWNNSPCRDSAAPPITNVSPGSRARDPNLTPTPMPEPVVNIVNPQPLPDPTGMASAMGLLGTPDIFRDMSGRAEVASLLGQLASGSIGLPQAQEKARQIQSAGGTHAGGGTAAAAPGVAAGNSVRNADPIRTYDQLQNVEQAYKRGAISAEARRSASGNIVGDTSGPDVVFARNLVSQPVEVRLRLFIPSPAVDLPGADPLGGDGRGFSYDGGSHRAMVDCALSFDSSLASPFVGPHHGADLYLREFGESAAFAEEDAFEVEGKPWWWADLRQGAQPIRGPARQTATDEHLTATAELLEHNPLFSVDNQAPTIRLVMRVTAAIPSQIQSPAPTIDANLELYLTAGPTLRKVLYRLKGVHDGFPAYELYINRQRVYGHDPVALDQWPATSLWGTGDFTPDTGWRALPSGSLPDTQTV